MLAGELALAGVDVVVVERRADQSLAGARAGGLHARTIEVLDQRGLADRFLTAGQTAQIVGFAQIRLDLSDFPTRHPYGLALWQEHIERILAGWVDELGVSVHRGCEVRGVAQDGDGVDVALADGSRLRASYVVGCDGARSVVRKAAGIAFAGWDPTTSYLLAEVDMPTTDPEPPWGIRHDEVGVHALAEPVDGGPMRVMVTERAVGPTAEPTLRDLTDGLIAAYGTDFGIDCAAWLSRFTDATRQATAYRERRLLLAGDAAHVHHPIGGQGLNTGVQDAVNLGWKLAAVVDGRSPETLLDSYHAERHPVAARVLRTTMAQIAVLRRPDERTQALRETLTELLDMDEPRRRFAARMSGLDIRYELGAGHPLTGRRMPDLDLDGGGRVYDLLHRARPMLLNLGEPGAVDRWSGRVAHVDAASVGGWELPAVGVVDAPATVLIRPDGYVAWAGDPGDPALTAALDTWT